MFKLISIKRSSGVIKRFSHMYQLRYTIEDQKKILLLINESKAEELHRFNISKNRVHKIQEFRKKHGNFNSLEGILDVDGLGVKVLEKFCESILNHVNGSDMKGEEEEVSLLLKSKKKLVTESSKINRRHLITPFIELNQVNALQRAVGIHISNNAVAWTCLDRNGNVQEWDLHNLESNSKKLHITTIFEIVQDIYNKLPSGDLYIMEDKNLISQQNSTSMRIVSLENCQLTAMLLAFLNNSKTFIEEVNNGFLHHVFFLRSRVTARLFGSLVGSERVSAQTTVLSIIEEDKSTSGDENISVNESLKQNYLNKTSVEKENLCWSLLLTMAFMNLIVHKNETSLNMYNKK